MEIKYSIIITSYNRAWCIERAIRSAYRFLEMAAWCGEIVIVDDGSEDDTVNIENECILSLPGKCRDRVKLICFEKNRGVCAAKNAGTNAARGEWVLFLDSDDELIPESYGEVDEILNKKSNSPVHFFATINELHSSINITDVVFLDINKLILTGTGGRDAVPVIRSNVKKQFLYDEDIQGYESLSYLRMARFFKKLVLHSTPLVLTHTLHLDRLSSKAGKYRRFGDLARGHCRVLTEHWMILSMASRLKMIFRYLRARLASLFYDYFGYVGFPFGVK